jgi:hypothetical protein
MQSSVLEGRCRKTLDDVGPTAHLLESSADRPSISPGSEVKPLIVLRHSIKNASLFRCSGVVIIGINWSGLAITLT